MCSELVTSLERFNPFGWKNSFSIIDWNGWIISFKQVISFKHFDYIDQVFQFLTLNVSLVAACFLFFKTKLLTYFMPMLPFCTPREHQKHLVFSCFQGGLEKILWPETLKFNNATTTSDFEWVLSFEWVYDILWVYHMWSHENSVPC